MLSEQALTYLESQIPELAEQATKQAFWQTLASGDSVLIAEKGNLVEISPDGSRKFIKKITEQIVVKERYFIIND